MSNLVEPSSYAQRMFWLLEQISPEMPAYNLARAIKIEGPLEVEILHETFRTLLRRHDILRTSFLEADGELLQCVNHDAQIDMAFRDLSEIPPDAQTAEVLAIAEDECRKSFDLERAPLLRLTLIRLGAEAHTLVLGMHHIVTDGWSMSILFGEMTDIYGKLAAHEPVDLPKPALQYVDFARWQRDHLTEAAQAVDIAFWKETLSGCPDLLEMPTDRPRPPVQSHRGSTIDFQIDRTLVQRLKQLCSREGVTLHMGLLAVFQTLLTRYSGQVDILVGTPTAGRNDPALAHVIGCFVNTLVIRGNFSGNPTFLDLLQQVRGTALAAYAHQDLPFERLLAALKPERTTSHTPIFQTMFVFHNAPKQILGLPGLSLRELELDSGLAKFDLTLEIMEKDGGLNCWLEYSSDLFEQATAERMTAHFQCLLSSAVDNPAQPIAKLEMLTAAELQQIIFDWNATSVGYSQDLTIARAFEDQVARTPDAIALLDEANGITYRDLNAQADAVARALIARGVGPDAPVGVYMKRSIDAFAAILGVLKAGSPYQPLDTAQPSHRLQLLIANADTQLVLTSRALQSALPDSVQTILIDADIPFGTDHVGVSPRKLSGELAYVIWTSGSTGVPKGVMGTHRATMNRFEWMYRTYPFSPGEVCCQKSALGFVDSIWEMFGPLLRGIPNVIVPDNLMLEPEALLDLLAQRQITRIVLVPTLLRVLLDHAPDLGTRVPRLRLWTVSGEYLPMDLAKRFREAFPGAVLLNLYGSSEVAADVTCYQIDNLEGMTAVPIGKPIANSEIFILDDVHQPVPIGVHGTIYVGGECLSAGYWQRPDLTQERFIANPFPTRSERLFATGDRARYLPDGQIEYLGRRDAQTKIRGVRIELGEIETNLAAHPSIREAVVVAWETSPEDKQLVAYVVGQNGTPPPSEELRRFLRGRLPLYMVPTTFMELAELPLLPSGKVNRQALPVPPTLTPANTHKAGSLQNAVERQLASIWCELLHVNEVDRADNFFDLGGNSLLAMQVIARIRKVFEVEVSIRSLFDQPTIEALSAEIDKAKASGAVARTPALVARARPAPSVDALTAELRKLSPEQIELLLQQVRSEQGARS